MPIFEYQCLQCSSKFEKIVYGDEGEIRCPECTSTQLQKLLSTFAVAADNSRSAPESGPCPCGAAERGMCQMMK